MYSISRLIISNFYNIKHKLKEYYLLSLLQTLHFRNLRVILLSLSYFSLLDNLVKYIPKDILNIKLNFLILILFNFHLLVIKAFSLFRRRTYYEKAQLLLSLV